MVGMLTEVAPDRGMLACLRRQFWTLKPLLEVILVMEVLQVVLATEVLEVMLEGLSQGGA